MHLKGTITELRKENDVNVISRLIHMLNGNVDASSDVSILARVPGSSISAGCSIGRHTRISRSDLGVMCKINKHVKIKQSFLSGYNSIGSGVRLKQASLGLYSYIANNTSLKNVEIGNFCSIGPNVKNHLGNHPTQVFVSTHPAFYSPNSPTGAFVKELYFEEFGKDVSIGNDVWIGAESLLMDGVNIGNGAVVATRSVVTKDVPPYAIVGGVPAKFIRYRFDEETISLLEQSQWWDRDLEWIQENISLFHHVRDFLKATQEQDLG